MLTVGAAFFTMLFCGWAVATWQEQMRHPDLLGWVAFTVQGVLGLASFVFGFFFALASLPEGDPLKDTEWRELLFRDHSKAQLRTWARDLRYFRFVRGSGGGMDDHGDCLLVALHAPLQADVEAILVQLGATVELQGSDQVDLRNEPLCEFVSVHIGDHLLGGYRTHDRFELSLSDVVDPWCVTQASVDIAKAIEPLFDTLSECMIDPPQDNRHCICPRYYASFWESGK